VLGHGDTSEQLLPKEIEVISNAIAVVANGNTTGNETFRGIYSFVLTEDGEVYSFGKSLYGILGHGNTNIQLTPKKIEKFRDGATELSGAQLPKVTAVSAGQSHALLLTETGDVYSMGRGWSGA